MAAVVPQPIEEHAQVQLLTTALKNICNGYEAGGTVLRELLQNADDAGATEVRFILDEETHPSDALMDPALQKYQGPSLLAFNNAVFADRDFKNISRLGDSMKKDDGGTTGRFGLGFNSVYNWTDSPSILSRHKFCILDPHHEWSKGGPTYDFPAGAQSPAMINHIKAFAAVMKRTDVSFDGTIVRIPLRTTLQSQSSQISSSPTSISDIISVFENFAEELGEKILLFMRSVEKLEMVSRKGTIRIEMGSPGTIRVHKQKVKQAVERALTDSHFCFDHPFQATITYEKFGKIKATDFIIHHQILGGAMDLKLQEWCSEQKLIPWVAVASVPTLSSQSFEGYLFSVLPLPVKSNQPIHSHGLFSLQPDRASLKINAQTNQDQNPAIWNKWLFERAIPESWVKLLLFLAKIYPQESPFRMWPQLAANNDHLVHATRKVPDIIERECHALWPTCVGYVNSNDGILSTKSQPKELKAALHQAHVPMVYVPQRLLSRAKEIFCEQTLSPHTLCERLRSNDGVCSVDSQGRLQILDYVLTHENFFQYGGLEIFPFEDGAFGAIGNNRVAFVSRNGPEEKLFLRDVSRNIDVKRLLESSRTALRHGCQKKTVHPSIQFRTVISFREYALTKVFTHFSPDEDMVDLDRNQREFVGSAMAWMQHEAIDILDHNLLDLWLIPLSNQKYRKVKSSKGNRIYFGPSGALGDIMWKIDDSLSVKSHPLIMRGSVQTRQVLSGLRKYPDLMPKLWVSDANDIFSFIDWLQEVSALVEETQDTLRNDLVKAILGHLQSTLPEKTRKLLGNRLISLRLFRTVSWKEDEKKKKMDCLLSWPLQASNDVFIGLLEGVSPVPDVPGTQFLLAEYDSPSRKLLEFLRIAKCVSRKILIQDVVIPAWRKGQSNAWSGLRKAHMSKFILDHLSSLDLAHQIDVKKLPMVLVSRLDGKPTLKFSIASNLIDRSKLDLARLCFDNEEVVPNHHFFQNCKIQLDFCGLKCSLDEDFVENRARCYGSGQYPPLEVRSRAEMLLTEKCTWTSPVTKWKMSSLRSLPWLPTCDVHGNFALKSAKDCRSHDDGLLCSSQLPIVTVATTQEWEERLGWIAVLPNYILLAQIKFGIETKDRKIVSAVLTYIARNDLLKSLRAELKKVHCVFAGNDLFLLPSCAFHPDRSNRTNLERLQPYIGVVESKFWEKHERLLLDIGVREHPVSSNLLDIQAILGGKPRIGGSDVQVAIEVLNLVSQDKSVPLESLKVITEEYKLVPLAEVICDDLGTPRTGEEGNFAHPDIPRQILHALHVDGRRQAHLNRMFDFSNASRFHQAEDPKIRINDTLERYPVETTFREYLANADDAKASEVNWLLDDTQYRGRNLIAPSMKHFQGPALLVHNNSVFTDADFEGFQKLGEGSKFHDPKAIGQFGRGSQTMYHWTDVPMILSANRLIILDPHGQYICSRPTADPVFGISLDLKTFKTVCEDQFAPFHGLWKYTTNLDYYPGTIFRFPLRMTPDSSSISKGRKHLEPKEARRLMESYFDEARISLLFLRNVKSLNFKIRGQSSAWSVTRKPSSGDGRSFAKPVDFSIRKSSADMTHVTGTDRWMVAIKQYISKDNLIPPTSRKARKNTECGLAALMCSDEDYESDSPQFSKLRESRMFTTTPLPLESDLPVHVHASFDISGDRQAIAFDDRETQFHDTKFNRYLLQEILPEVYLNFLESIGTSFGRQIFRFWPTRARGCAELLCEAFWKEIPNSTRRLFPRQLTVKERLDRQDPEFLDISKAVFDFLPAAQSDKLAPLLMSLEVNLVGEVPSTIENRMQLFPNIECVSMRMLRELFKSEGAGKCMQATMAQDGDVWNALASVIFVESEHHLLQGCRVVPLADGTLGTLKFTGSATQQEITDCFFLADEQELKLFKFASMILVWESSIGTEIASFLRRHKFNVIRLTSKGVKRLLTMKPVVSSRTDEEDEWLADFWKYWSSKFGKSERHVFEDTDFKIFRAVRDGVVVYASPSELDSLPAVVVPASSSQQILCKAIPGLYQFDRTFMPNLYSDFDSTLSSTKFLLRFFRALQILGSEAGDDQARFAMKNLNDANLQLLRTLILENISPAFSISDPKRYSSFHDTLISLPLWPSFIGYPVKKLLPAREAIMTDSPQCLVPWMKDFDKFIDPEFLKQNRNQRCLKDLKVHTMNLEDLLCGDGYVFPIPQPLDTTRQERLCRLISDLALHQSHRDWTLKVRTTLQQVSIALDGHFSLKKASELYDHTDPIFLAAFRHEKRLRMLHERVREHSNFWEKLGLRRRNSSSSCYRSEDYIQCLQSLVSRLDTGASNLDLHLAEDEKIILGPLTDDSRAFSTIDAHDWQQISDAKVFRAITNFNGEYDHRRDGMSKMAFRQPLLNLREVISYCHSAICWSQTPFTIHEPTKEVLRNVPGRGQPKIAMVWLHLKHLASMAQQLKQHQVIDFLKDLTLSYEHLQENLDPVLDKISFAKEPIWLNLNSFDGRTELLDDVRYEWCTNGELYLSLAADCGALKAVKSGLLQFERLLKKVGCDSIKQPTTTLPQIQADDSLTTILLQMKIDQSFTDVEFQTEGKVLHAHRMVLAAKSKKWAAEFSGRWNMTPVIKYDIRADEDDFLSYHTLSSMIAYAYEDAIDWTITDVLKEDDEQKRESKLAMLLDLCKGADYMMMEKLKTQVDCKIVSGARLFINLANVEDVEQRASDSGAVLVGKYCVDFIGANRQAVRKANVDVGKAREWWQTD